MEVPVAYGQFGGKLSEVRKVDIYSPRVSSCSWRVASHLRLWCGFRGGLQVLRTKVWTPLLRIQPPEPFFGGQFCVLGLCLDKVSGWPFLCDCEVSWLTRQLWTSQMRSMGRVTVLHDWFVLMEEPTKNLAPAEMMFLAALSSQVYITPLQNPVNA